MELGFWGGGASGMECRGSAGWFKKGRRVSGRACPVKGAARSLAGIAVFSCAAGGEEDDPDVWVRPGSEGGAGRGRATRALTPRPRWQGVGARESGRWQVDLRVGR